MRTELPEMPDLRPVAAGEALGFACGPALPCFTECCRDLDLALSPYDVLRLKRRLGLSSGEFMRRYALVGMEDGAAFPICRLAMVDDGRASCVFVRPEGCSVYADRPAACRAYPLARGVSLEADGGARERLALLREPHCRGFSADIPGCCADFLESQGLAEYNRFGDALLRLHQHPLVRSGAFRPDEQQARRYVLALYDLDRFRSLLARGALPLAFPLTPAQRRGLEGDDGELLLLAIAWLEREFFGKAAAIA